LLHVSDKSVALFQEVIISRRDFDDLGFNLDNGKDKAVFLYFLMSGCTELIEISDCRRMKNVVPPDRSSGRSLEDYYDNSVLQELVNERFLARDATQQK
jgi:hypothetical protein